MKHIKRKIRDRKLTQEEIERDRKIIESIKKELPELIKKHNEKNKQ